MDKNDVLILAKNNAEKSLVYNALYPALPKTFEEIPVLQKTDLLEYESLTGQPYHGVADTSMYEKVSTSGRSGDKLEVLYSPADVGMAHMQLFAQPAFQWMVKPSFIFIETFYGSPSFDPDATEYVTRTLEEKQTQATCIITERIKECEGTVILVGESTWFDWMLQMTDVVDVKQHVICYTRKNENYSPKSCGFENVEKQIIVLPTAEVGIIGYYTTWCNTSYYHAYRSDLYVEEVKGQLVVTSPRAVFDFIRYNLGDNVNIHDIECSCGYKGNAVEFIRR